ncbi:hypothetical protein [Streptomyces hoynatensis]|nr:hypothetical protein [Streptomyces hoynatensis]
MDTAMRNGARFLRLKTMASAALAALLLGACSSDDGDEGDESSGAEFPLAASEVCDGVLSGAAAGDLDALAERDRFGEMDGEGNASVDLAQYLVRLRSTNSREQEYCTIGMDTASPFMRLAFGWDERDGDFDDAAQDVLVYSSGSYAYALDRGALIYFPCDIPDRTAPGLLRARLGMPYGLEDPDKAMSVLNSASRAIADGLGCLEGAGLPEGRPGRAPE